MRGVLKRAWIAAAAATTALSSAAFAADSFEDVLNSDDPVAVINDAFGVSQSDLAYLDVPTSPDEPFTVMAPLDGQMAFLDFWPHSIRADDFQLIVQTGPNDFETPNPPAERTLRGTVTDVPTSQIAASLLHNGLVARVVMPDGSQHWIEPLTSKYDDAPPDLYIIYRGEDVLIDPNLLCGVTDPSGNGGAGGGAGGGDNLGNAEVFGVGGVGDGAETFCHATLAADADYLFFQRWQYSTPAVLERIEAIINVANLQYENETNTTHDIGTVLIRTTEAADPFDDTTDPGALLGDFQTVWDTNHAGIDRDVTHLFTGRDLDGGVIGIAFLGGVCNGNRYSLVQNLNSSNFALPADLSAHELGHNWNASHCTCGGQTMNPFLVGALYFGPATAASIIAFRDAAPCLDCADGDDITITTMSIRRGTLRHGDLSDVLAGDDSWLKVDSETAGNKELTVLIFDGTSPAADGTSLDVHLELGVTSDGVKTIVKLYDFDAGGWVTIDRFNQPRPDVLRDISVTDDPSRFIDAGGAVRLRIIMKSTANDFISRYDHVSMHVEPLGQ